MRRKWSSYETKFLLDNYHKLTNYEISLKLNRTESSIINKMNLLRITRPKKPKRESVKRHDLYNRWLNMRSRCEKKKCEAYHNYGGRGIKVCEEWKTFKNFKDWAIKTGWQKHLTLDRIDNNGDYCPENCRWANNFEQANNTRKNILLTAFGETKTISEWCRDDRCKTKYHTLKHRYHKNELTPEEMLTKSSKGRHLSLTAFGETKNLKEWSEDPRCHVKYSGLYLRFKDQKMSPEEMLTLPPQR